MNRRIDISWKTIVFITLFLLGIWITYQIIDLILLLFVALILMSALSPLVSLLSKFKIPKALSILLIYILIFGILGMIITLALTPLVVQTNNLATSLPNVFNNILRVGHVDQTFIQKEINNFSDNIFVFTTTVFSHIITIILILVITFYLLLDKENLEKRTASLFIGKEERVRKIIVEVEEKLGSWLRGQLLLSLIIGVVSYIGLTFLQIPYAFPLAIWSGLLEVLPVIGPIISSIPAILLALTISPVLGGGVAAMYFVIQQLESHFVVPQVMKKAVGLNPLVVILAIAVGSRLLGVGGAFLAVPIVVVAQILVIDILKEKS